MESTLIDKVENNKILKAYKFAKISALVMPFLLIMCVFLDISNTHVDIINLGLMFFMNILFIGSYLSYKFKISKNKGMPFVEWWTDKVIFRSSKTGQEFKITLDNISNISVRLDDVLISTKSNESFEINLNEYIEYDQRMKIKNSFIALSKEINHKIIPKEAISN